MHDFEMGRFEIPRRNSVNSVVAAFGANNETNSAETFGPDTVVDS